MEENTKMLEALVERTTEYGKTSLALAKLKVLEKTSQIVSTILPYAVALLLLAAFLLFLSLGLAFWLGDLLENNNLGFFSVALMYAILGTIFRFFLFQSLKKLVGNYIINLMLT